MGDETVNPPAPKPAKKRGPRTATKAAPTAGAAEAEVAQSAVVESAPSSAPVAPAKGKAASKGGRQVDSVQETVAKQQKVLAEALAKAQAITYDPPESVPAPRQSAKADKLAAAEKPPKAKKPKLVRDSYAMPEAEYTRIGELKKRMAALGSAVKKSELLRGGIAALAALDDAALKAVMAKIDRIKTGRPRK